MADKGFLFFRDWYEPMRQLPAEEFKTIFYAMIDYQENDVPPPSFSGALGIISAFVFPQLERRKLCSKAGKAGMQKRWKENAASPPFVGVNNDVNNKTIAQDKDKDKDKDIDIDEDNARPHDAPARGAHARERSSSESDEESDEEAEHVFRLYGELCPSLAQTSGMSEKQRAQISEALAVRSPEDLRVLFTKAEETPFLRGEGAKGWRASLGWLLVNADRVLGGEFDSYEREDGDSSSFDTDEFFAAALARTYSHEVQGVGAW